MTIARWSLFAWGAFACGVMMYFAGWWFIQPPDPSYNELQFGVAMGFAFGLPAFVALPFVACFGRPLLAGKRKLLLLSPTMGAAMTLSVVAALRAA